MTIGQIVNSQGLNMDWIGPLASIMDDIPPPLRIVGVAILVIGVTLPLFRGSHPAYLSIAFFCFLGFLIILLPQIFDPHSRNETWLRDGLLECVIVTGLNPNGDNNLAVRREPSTSSEEITQRYDGQKLWVHGKTKGWLRVRFVYRGDQIEGWVAKYYTNKSAC